MCDPAFPYARLGETKGGRRKVEEGERTGRKWERVKKKEEQGEEGGERKENMGAEDGESRG